MEQRKPLRVVYDLRTHERKVDRSGVLQPVSPELFGYLNSLSALLPAVVGIAHWGGDPNGQRDARCHERFHELVFIINGQVTYEINGAPVSVREGDVVLLKPSDVHRYRAGSSFDAASMHASFETLDAVAGQGAVPDGPVGEDDAFLRFLMDYYPRHHTMKLAQPRVVHELVLAMVREYRVPGPASGLLISARFIELLVMLARNAAFGSQTSGSTHSKARDELLVGQVTTFLDEHFGEDVDISRVFDKFFLHPNYCRNIFKTMTGMSVSAYLLRVRMSRARDMLLETERPIKEIAAAVGTPDYAYFQRAFKKIHGVPPGRMRRRQR